MAIQAPSHIDQLRIFVNGNFAEIAVAFLAVQPGGDMRPVVVMDEIRHLCDGDPHDGFIILDSLNKGLEQDAGFRDGHLLVTAPAFCLGWKPGRRTAQSAGMAIQTLDAHG